MILLSPDAASDVERVREFLDINNPEAAKRAFGMVAKPTHACRPRPLTIILRNVILHASRLSRGVFRRQTEDGAGCGARALRLVTSALGRPRTGRPPALGPAALGWAARGG
jgi:hypothetical protein